MSIPTTPAKLDYWRYFLQTSEYDIFETIKNAILVAATDHPDEFQDQEEHLMLTISTALSVCQSQEQCIGSEMVDKEKRQRSEGSSKSPDIIRRWSSSDGKVGGKRAEREKKKETNVGKMNDESSEGQEKDVANTEGYNIVSTGSWCKEDSRSMKRKLKGKNVVSDDKQIKITPSSGNNAPLRPIGHIYRASSTGKDDITTELVAKEVEIEQDDRMKENEMLQKVLKIKDAFTKVEKQNSEPEIPQKDLTGDICQQILLPVMVFELLKILEKMHFSADMLMVTEIAAVVRKFRNHEDKRIHYSASYLIEIWETVLDEWVCNANAARVLEDNNKAAKNDEPYHSIGAGPSLAKSGSIQFYEGPSKPPSFMPLSDIGVRGPAKAKCMAVSPPAKKWHPSSNKFNTGSRLQFGGSLRGSSSNFPKSQPSSGLQMPKLTTGNKKLDTKNKMEVPAPAKKMEDDPVKERLKIARRKLQEGLLKSEQSKEHHTGRKDDDKDPSIGELLSRYRVGLR